MTLNSIKQVEKVDGKGIIGHSHPLQQPVSVFLTSY